MRHLAAAVIAFKKAHLGEQRAGESLSSTLPLLLGLGGYRTHPNQGQEPADQRHPRAIPPDDSKRVLRYCLQTQDVHLPCAVTDVRGRVARLLQSQQNAFRQVLLWQNTVADFPG